MQLNVECAINPLSFGNISYGVLNALFELNTKFDLFPIGGQLDLSVFNKISDGLKKEIHSSAQNAFKNYSSNNPTLKIWHINGSQHSVGKNQYLLTFHELDQLTPSEVNILNQQKGIFVTSNFSKNVFTSNGVTVPVYFIKLGFDKTHFYRTNKQYYTDKGITWAIFGKFENRKRHEKTIKSWIKKYGNNAEHRLHLHIHNPFAKPEDMNAIYGKLFDGKPIPFNVKIYGFQPTNSEMNECYNVPDIVIDMSGGESISLPAMTCVGLGKHAVVHYNSAIKDWATKENSILVNPNSKIPAYDNSFFRQGDLFNQGNIFDFNEEEFINSCELAIKRFQTDPINKEGFKLVEDYSFENGVKNILTTICNDIGK